MGLESKFTHCKRKEATITVTASWSITLLCHTSPKLRQPRVERDILLLGENGWSECWLYPTTRPTPAPCDFYSPMLPAHSSINLLLWSQGPGWPQQIQAPGRLPQIQAPASPSTRPGTTTPSPYPTPVQVPAAVGPYLAQCQASSHGPKDSGLTQCQADPYGASL